MIRLTQPCVLPHKFVLSSEGSTTGQQTWICDRCGAEETRWPDHPGAISGLLATPFLGQVPSPLTVSQAPTSQYAKGWNDCIREIAAAPVNEESEATPVAWMKTHFDGIGGHSFTDNPEHVADWEKVGVKLTPLYAAPAPAAQASADAVFGVHPMRANAQPDPWTDLLAYVLQDDLHNRLTPRVIDIAYSVFMLAKVRDSDEHGPTDWMNDARPMVLEAIAKIRKDLAAARQHQSGEAPSQVGAQAERDAARYQWLRQGDNDELVIQHGPVAPDYHWLPRLERLDAMIDAALSAENTTGGAQ